MYNNARYCVPYVYGTCLRDMDICMQMEGKKDCTVRTQRKYGKRGDTVKRLKKENEDTRGRIDGPGEKGKRGYNGDCMKRKKV